MTATLQIVAILLLLLLSCNIFLFVYGTPYTLHNCCRVFSKYISDGSSQKSVVTGGHYANGTIR